MGSICVQRPSRVTNAEPVDPSRITRKPITRNMSLHSPTVGRPDHPGPQNAANPHVDGQVPRATRHPRQPDRGT